MAIQTSPLIVGGGLSGLSLACAALAGVRGRDFMVLEARERFGGRILGQDVGGGAFDLGPAWFWPGQPRIAALIQTLGLTRFDQYADGDLLFEDEQGNVQRGRGYASMQGSYRLHGGFAALIEHLVAALDPDRLKRNAAVTSITRSDDGVMARTHEDEVIHARHCVLAVPPRLAANLSFAPELGAPAHRAMTGIATWMAGQAKAVAVYDRPFWRDAGLSGDAMSRRGPMVEIHDASVEQGGPYALFGFIGVPPAARQDAQALRQSITTQLGRMFGPDAADPRALLLKDWALDAFTSTSADMKPLFAHPQYGLPPALSELWDGRLVFVGTEVAPQFGGYLEGALEAADLVLERLAHEYA